MNEILSERLLLRPLTESDVSERYVAWLNDPDVNRFLETRFSPQSLTTCSAFVAQTNADPRNHLKGIFDRETQCHIGNIKIGFIKSAHKSGQLSLFIGDKSFWGRGLATEAILTLTRWAFDSLGLERIEAGCYDGNIGSLRAFLRAGYSVEGYQRKSVVVGDRRTGSFLLGILKNELV